MRDNLFSKTTWVSRKGMAILFLVVFSLAVVNAPGMGYAAEDDNESDPWSEAGLGVASGVLTIVYLPFKVVYAAVGSIIGGFTYALTGGDLETAQAVWEPSLFGTYVITPSHLQGDEPVRFYGVEPYNEYEDVNPSEE